MKQIKIGSKIEVNHRTSNKVETGTVIGRIKAKTLPNKEMLLPMGLNLPETVSRWERWVLDMNDRKLVFPNNKERTDSKGVLKLAGGLELKKSYVTG